jgi:hypothetical protein
MLEPRMAGANRPITMRFAQPAGRFMVGPRGGEELRRRWRL